MVEEENKTTTNEEENKKENELSSINNETQGKKKKNARVKYIINILLVVSLTVIALVISLGGNFEQSFSILGTCKWTWLLVLFGIMIFVTLLRSLILFCFARLYTRDYHYHQALAVESIGNFYSAVTPGATGGQVMEAYVFKKQGIQISNAVSMLAMYSIVYQIILTTFGLISFIVKFNILNDIGFITINLGFAKFDLSIWALTIIGFLLNVGVIAIVFLMAYWKGFHNFIMGPCVSLLYKLHILRNPDKSRENLRVQVENFKIEFKRLLTNVPFFILTAVMFVVFFIAKFCIPYFAGLALGNQGTGTFWDSVFLSNYHQMVTGLIPLPGSAGISEYFFTQLFVDSHNYSQGFYYLPGDASMSNSLCSAALLLWRTVSFTLPLIIAGFVTAFYRVTPKDVSKEGEMPSRQTIVDYQRETLVLRENEVRETQSVLSKSAIMKKLATYKDKKAIKNVTNTHKKASIKKNSNNENEVKKDEYESVNIDIEDES